MTAMPLHLWTRAREPARADDLLAHADALYNFARHLTGDASDAEDLVQETYARALRARATLGSTSNPKAWLCSILRNAYISRYRHDQRHPAAEAYDTTEPSSESAATAHGGRGEELEAEQLRRLVSSDIEAALRTLSDDARTVVLLDVEGLTETEVALVLGCPVGTVKSRLNRARAALRARLADYARRDEP
jgi:RNA polymerase sigma-70 factor, ECF subfamily